MAQGCEGRLAVARGESAPTLRRPGECNREKWVPGVLPGSMRDSTPMWAKWVRTLVGAQIVQPGCPGVLCVLCSVM